MAFEQKAGEQRPAGILPDRAQPHDPEVEKAVLAAMLREPESCVDTVIMFLHDADVFYSHIHREIYQVIRELHDDNSKAVDLVTISHELQTKGKLDAVGGNAYLAELYNAISTTVNIEAWCNILKKYAILRRMIDVCSGALGKCYDSGADAASLVEEIENDIYKVRGEEAANNIVELKDIIKDEFQSLMSLLEDNAEAGISTGYAAIDKMTGGLKPGEMFVLAARPSIGKTSLALNVIANVALKKYTPRPRKVAFFSLEMTSSQITRRLLCSEAGVPESVFWNKTFNHADLTKFTSAASEFYNASIFIDETAGLSIAELRAKARRLKMKENIELIVIDYLQLMHADGRVDSRQQEVAEISGGIKALAKDLKIPVLVLAQLNREVDKTAGAGAKPKLANLRESGSIEQDADVVTFLHRNREDAKTVAQDGSVEALWIVEKNRNGQIGEVRMNFFPSRTRFEVASPRSEEDCPN